MDLMAENLISSDDVRKLLGAPQWALPDGYELTVTTDADGYEYRIFSYVGKAPSVSGSDGDGGGRKPCDCGGAKARTTHSHWCSSRGGC